MKSEHADKQVSSEDERTPALQEGREALTPWLGWGLAPMAWALHQGLGYAMVPWLCAQGVRWPYHALTALALTFCALGLLAALHALRRSRKIRPPRSADRMRMMSLVGFMLCATALGGITVQYVPTFWLDTCAGVN